MGRKKKQEEKDYIWCYYCDREFDDENTLISHQVARHFKCETCGKKLGTFRGLLSHQKTTHNVDMKAVPHALTGRDNTATDIHGMTGIPEVALFEYKVKKARLLGLPIPTREAATIRNPQQEFEAKLEARRVKKQIRDSMASMAVQPSLPVPTSFLPAISQSGLPPSGAAGAYPLYPGYGGPYGSSYGSQSGMSATLTPVTPAATPTPVAPPRLLYMRTDISMEEWRATQPQYRYKEFIAAVSSTV